MTTPTCDACTRPVTDNARLCSRKPTSANDPGGCTERLERDLGDIGALAGELDTTRLKQDRMGGAATGVLSRSAETPLPWNQHAAEVADALRGTVVGWVRVVLEERGGPLPADTMQALSGYLLRQDVREWIRHHPDAAEMADEVADAVGRARRAIDRKPGRTYAGPCREDVPATMQDGETCCVAELYAVTGARVVTCDHCSTVHNARERKLWLLSVAEDQLATVAELSALLTTDRPFSRHTIKSWIKRNRLAEHGAYEPARYRIGDAVALAFVEQQRESA